MGPRRRDAKRLGLIGVSSDLKQDVYVLPCNDAPPLPSSTLTADGSTMAICLLVLWLGFACHDCIRKGVDLPRVVSVNKTPQ